MKKGIIIILVIVLSLSICAGCVMLGGCTDDDKSGKRANSVRVEVTHPEIEGEVVYARYYYMKYDGKPKVFDVKIYSKDEKKYISDKDVVSKDLQSLIEVSWKRSEESSHHTIDLKDENAWPTEIGEYEISVNFNDFGIRDTHKLDPNYKTPLGIFFTLIIEEEVSNE